MSVDSNARTNEECQTEQEKETLEESQLMEIAAQHVPQILEVNNAKPEVMLDVVGVWKPLATLVSQLPTRPWTSACRLGLRLGSK